jgi:hypothetical protein
LVFQFCWHLRQDRKIHQGLAQREHIFLWNAKDTKPKSDQHPYQASLDNPLIRAPGALRIFAVIKSVAVRVARSAFVFFWQQIITKTQKK